MPTFNNLTIIGRLGGDPKEDFSKTNNMAISRFSVAVDRTRKRDGEPDTDWFRVVAFGRTAEFCNTALHKGSVVCVNGSVQLDQWVSNKDGKDMTAMSVAANSVQALDPPPSRDEPRREESRRDERPREPQRTAKRDYDDDGEDPFSGE